MENQVLYTDILLGNRNTDTMRKIIKETICSLVEPLRGQNEPVFETKKGIAVRRMPELYYWAVRFGKVEGKFGIISIDLYKDSDVLHYFSQWFIPGGKDRLERHHVEITFNRLQGFVDGMFETFPSLRLLMEPTLSASKLDQVALSR